MRQGNLPPAPFGAEGGADVAVLLFALLGLGAVAAGLVVVAGLSPEALAGLGLVALAAGLAATVGITRGAEGQRGATPPPCGHHIVATVAPPTGDRLLDAIGYATRVAGVGAGRSNVGLRADLRGLGEAGGGPAGPDARAALLYALDAAVGQAKPGTPLDLVATATPETVEIRIEGTRGPAREPAEATALAVARHAAARAGGELATPGETAAVLIALRLPRRGEDE